VRLVLLGYGNIGRAYEKAVRALGKEIACIVRKDLEKGNDYGIQQISLTEFLNSSKAGVDGIIVALPPKKAMIALRAIIGTNIPTLIEKPLFLHLEEYREMEQSLKMPENQALYLALNRRFYKSVRTAKKICEASDCYVEGRFYDTIEETKERRGLSNEECIFYSCIHWLDLIVYMTGEKIEHLNVEVSKIGRASGGLVTLKKNRELIGSAGFYFNAAGRHCIRMYGAQREYELCPIEQLYVLDLKRKTERYKNTREFELHREPVAEEQDIQIKPGFLEMTSYFLGSSEGRGPMAETLSLGELGMLFNALARLKDGL